jgi:hypothetical protein
MMQFKRLDYRPSSPHWEEYNDIINLELSFQDAMQAFHYKFDYLQRWKVLLMQVHCNDEGDLGKPMLLMHWWEEGRLQQSLATD